MPVTVGNPPSIRTPGGGPNGPAPLDMRILRDIQGPGQRWQPPLPATATTIRYVRKTGSDSNGGTSPSDAWLTYAKAVSTAAPGTAVYFGAGTYRETNSFSITPTAAAPVWLIGDTDGVRTGDAGAVILSAFTTSNTVAPANATLINLNGKSNINHSGFVFVGGLSLSTIVLATTATSKNISFTDCCFLSGGHGNVSFNVTSEFGTPLNWQLTRCLFGPSGAATNCNITLTTGVGSDYDANVRFNDCIWVGSSLNNGRCILVTNSGTAANKGGGVYVTNCTNIGGVHLLQTANSGQNSTLFPCVVTNSFSQSSGGLAAASAGTIVEDYNILVSASPRTNVTAGVHSVSDQSRAPLIHIGQERIWGGLIRSVGQPMAGSGLLLFGNEGAQKLVDLAGTPRPAGVSLPAAGSLERNNNFVTDPAPIGAGTTPIKCTGFGTADFYVPVPTRAITISCLMKYTGTAAPVLQVLPNETIGVGQIQVSAPPNNAGVISTVTLPTFTPTVAGGMVIVRVWFPDQTGSAVLQVDNFSVSG